MSIRSTHTAGTGPAATLAASLAEMGVPCRVESRAGLAVVIAGPEAARQLAEPETRRRALALAREHGFTHLALELE
jgi:hypothetical protein